MHIRDLLIQAQNLPKDIPTGDKFVAELHNQFSEYATRLESKQTVISKKPNNVRGNNYATK